MLESLAAAWARASTSLKKPEKVLGPPSVGTCRARSSTSCSADTMRPMWLRISSGNAVREVTVWPLE